MNMITPMKLKRPLSLNTMFRSDGINIACLTAITNALRDHAKENNITIDDYSDGCRMFGFAAMLEDVCCERPEVVGWVFGYGYGCNRYTYPIIFAAPDTPVGKFDVKGYGWSNVDDYFIDI